MACNRASATSRSFAASLRASSSLASSMSSLASWIACWALSRWRSETGTACSARTVQPVPVTSAKPPSTKIRSVTLPFWNTEMTPGRTVEMRRAWPGSTPKSPSVPGTTTDSTSAENSKRSGETSSNLTVSAIFHPSQLERFPPKWIPVRRKKTRPLHLAEPRVANSGNPVPDRAPVSFRHVEPVHLGRGEPPQFLMFVAEPEFPLSHRQNAEGHDQHRAGGEHRVAPAIEQIADLGRDPQLFLQLPRQAGNRVLTSLQAAAGQLPLVALVLQENDLAADQAYALDGNRPER